MLEQQGHHVVDVLDLFNTLGIGKLRQYRNAVAHLPETTLDRSQLQRLDYFAWQLIPRFAGMLSQRHGVSQ